jgi:hypothetical protein
VAAAELGTRHLFRHLQSLFRVIFSEPGYLSKS